MVRAPTDTVTHQELKSPVTYSLSDIARVTFLFGCTCLPFYYLIFTFFKHDPTTLQTSWFIASALAQFMLIFSLRTPLFFLRAHPPSLSLVGLCCIALIIVVTLPFTAVGHEFFLFKSLTAHDMIIIASVMAGYFVAVEVVKLLYFRCLFGEKAYSKAQNKKNN